MSSPCSPGSSCYYCKHHRGIAQRCLGVEHAWGLRGTCMQDTQWKLMFIKENMHFVIGYNLKTKAIFLCNLETSKLTATKPPQGNWSLSSHKYLLLFTTQNQKQLKCLPTEEWEENNVICVYTIESCLAFKGHQVLTCAKTWKNNHIKLHTLLFHLYEYPE